jgi:hypothetical protein
VWKTFHLTRVHEPVMAGRSGCLHPSWRLAREPEWRVGPGVVHVLPP